MYITFVLGYICAIAFAFFKILDYPFGIPVIILGFIATLAFIILAIYEVFKSSKIKTYEKIIWTVCLFFLVNITGIIYLIVRKKHIISTTV